MHLREAKKARCAPTAIGSPTSRACAGKVTERAGLQSAAGRISSLKLTKLSFFCRYLRSHGRSFEPVWQRSAPRRVRAMSAEVPTPNAERPPARSRVSNRRQMLLFAALTLILAVATALGGRGWLM